MPPKLAKRKALANNGDNDLDHPDKATWPGWIEMESEPAFFNVMLKDMGVRGVKVSEVFGLDDEELAVLPQPVHALIFLFRYRETNKDDLLTVCPPDVWYAEQVPDFACATVALLNIVNNIPGLQMGAKLRAFKSFTDDMTPRLRGEAIDNFAFIKTIHNSFAREADILQADMHLKEKVAKAQKRQAVAKAQRTRAENAARRAKQGSSTENAKTTRTSGRPTGNKSPFHTSPGYTRSSKKHMHFSVPDDDMDVQMSGDDSSPNHIRSVKATPSKTDETKSIKGLDGVDDDEITYESDGAVDGIASIDTPTEPTTNLNKKLRLSVTRTKTKTKPDPNADYTSLIEENSGKAEPRRSGRKPQPRKDIDLSAQQADPDSEAEEEGFHFCAYMPIGGHVWKLDGMDKFPQDMGPIIPGVDWLSIVQPILQGRMAQYSAEAIEFNLMAVVHDPMVACVESLAANLNALRAVEEKLDRVDENWKSMTDDKNEECLTVDSDNLDTFGLQNVDMERAGLTANDAMALAEVKDLEQLLALWSNLSLQQLGLRRACLDEVESAQSDADKAEHRRHDYSTFAREWLGALAEQGVLEALLDAEDD